MKKILLPLFAATILLNVSCSRKPVRPVMNVHVKKELNAAGAKTDSPQDDWTYWYIIYSNNGKGYYYFTSTDSLHQGELHTVDFTYTEDLPVMLPALSPVDSFEVRTKSLSSDTRAIFVEKEPEAATTEDGIPVDMNKSDVPVKPHTHEDDTTDIITLQ